LVGIDIPDGQRDLGHAERLPGVGAVEDDVRHFAAAEGLGGLLAEHPADGVRDVGLTATIRPDDAGDAPLEIQRGFVREGFEPQHGQVLEEHGA
jgi:hypothetical protein